MGIDSSLTGVPDFDQMELVKQGTDSVTVTLSGNGAIGSKTVTHNLGFFPFVQAFIGSTSTIWLPMPAILGSSTGTTEVSITEYATITNITSTSFQVWLYKAGTSGTSTYTFTYYLFRAKANTN